MKGFIVMNNYKLNCVPIRQELLEKLATFVREMLHDIKGSTSHAYINMTADEFLSVSDSHLNWEKRCLSSEEDKELSDKSFDDLALIKDAIMQEADCIPVFQNDEGEWFYNVPIPVVWNVPDTDNAVIHEPEYLSDIMETISELKNSEAKKTTAHKKEGKNMKKAIIITTGVLAIIGTVGAIIYKKRK